MVAVENVNLVYAKMENKPGTLERAARAFGEKRINIDALSLETVGSTGIARIETNRPRDAVDALRHAGIEAYESQFLLASIPNRPGELARIAGDVAASGINVESIVTTTDGRILIRTSDNERAMQILRKA
jgi:hypothetical protein